MTRSIVKTAAKAAAAAGAAAAVTVVPTVWAYKKAFSAEKLRGRDDKDFEFRGQMSEHRDEIVALIDRLKARPFEWVYTGSDDGLVLAGRLYDQGPDTPLVICFHGWKGTAFRDFAGGGNFLLDAGFSTLLVDERGQGVSGGKSMTFGILERFDVRSWAEFAHKRFGEERPVFLCGVSMGASAVLMASDLGLPKNVKGILADCPFNSPREILEKVAVGNMGLPPQMLVYAKAAARLLGGFRLEDISASESVRRSGLPVLLIHGTADGFVPSYMSAKIAAANPKTVRYELFEGAEHGMSYFADRGRYESLTVGFIEEQLGRASGGPSDDGSGADPHSARGGEETDAGRKSE